MEKKQPPCRHLRTKMAYISDERGRQYLEKTLPDESYWCARSMSPIGLDDAPAEPDFCRGRRPCYEPLSEDGTILIRTVSSTDRGRPV